MATDNCKNTYSPALGEVCWLEVPCTDVPRVVSFYRTVLGWDISDPDLSQTLMPSPIDGTDGVHMFQKGNLAGAFVKMSRPEGVAVVADREYLAKSPVLAYYLVERIEETLEKVEKAGGQVHMPKTAIAGGSMGWFARFIDSEGNLQGIWTKPTSPSSA